MSVQTARLAWNGDAISDGARELLRQVQRHPDLIFVSSDLFPERRRLRDQMDCAIEEAVTAERGNRSRAARRLGLTVRTVRNHSQRLALPPARPGRQTA